MTVPKELSEELGLDDPNEFLDISEGEVCRNDFLAYCVMQYPAFSFPRHIITIAMYLELVCKGFIKRLMIFAPPRHGKSEITSKLFPAYYVGHHKGTKTVAVATYGQELSNEIGLSLQQRMNSDVYKEIFPESTPSDSANAIRRLVTVNGGGFLTVGVGGALTGKGAHLRILDDPNKNREEAESDNEQEKQWNWWTSVFYTRGEQDIKEDGSAASDDDESPIVIILTRWSDKDIAKKLMTKQKEEEVAGIEGDRWTILNLPAICDQDNDPCGRPKVEDVEDPNTWRDEHALWPEKFSAKKLSKLRTAVGIRDWNSLYQQRPSSATGDLYKRAKWQFYAIGGVPPECSKPVQSWDCNYKETQDSDYAVGLVARVRKQTSVYLLARYKGRWPFSELQNKVRQAKIEYPDTTAIYVEEKANGRPIIDTLSKEIPGIIPVEPKTLGSKPARNEAAAKYQNSEVIYLPLGEPWVDDFVECLASYPGGENDDDADAFAQLVLMELGQPSTDALLRLLESELAGAGIDPAKVLEVDEDDPYAVYADESQIRRSTKSTTSNDQVQQTVADYRNDRINRFMYDHEEYLNHD